MSLLRCPKASAVGWEPPLGEDDRKDSKKKSQIETKKNKKDKKSDESKKSLAADSGANDGNTKLTSAGAYAPAPSTAATDYATASSSKLPPKKRRIDASVNIGDNSDNSVDADETPSSPEESCEPKSPPGDGKVVGKTEDDGDSKIDEVTEESDVSTIVTFSPLGSEIVVTGTAVVTVLDGRVEIMGCTVDSADETTHVQICSPDGTWSSALTIWDVSSTSSIEGREEAKGSATCTRIRISSLSWDGSESTRTFHVAQRSEVRSAITVAERWKAAADAVLSNSKQSPDSSVENAPDPARVLVCGAKGVGKSTYVRYLVNKMMTSDVVNRRKKRRVAVLDCDVGQPELGPPGLMTLTVLERPLLSPPHAHIICGREKYHSEQKGDKHADFKAASEHASAHFFGHISAKADPSSYTAAISCLVGQYETLFKKDLRRISSEEENKEKERISCVDALPLIVNTAGWVKGMGFEILSSIVDVVRPGHIVQIVGAARAKFFDLTPHAFEGRSIHVVEAFGRISQLPTEQDMTPAPSRSVSPVPPALGGGITAALPATAQADAPVVAATSTLRSLRLASYFLGGYRNLLASGASFWPASGGIYDPHCNVASALAAMKPYAVPFRSIYCSVPSSAEYLGTAQADELVLKSLDGAIVALCHWSEGMDKEEPMIQDRYSLRTVPTRLNTALLPCVGLGIVRGIDKERECFYILTPISPEELTSCQPNVLVRGRIQLPMECLFRGVHSEAFPYQCCDGLISGIGDDVMKSKNAPIRK